MRVTALQRCEQAASGVAVAAAAATAGAAAAEEAADDVENAYTHPKKRSLGGGIKKTYLCNE